MSNILTLQQLLRDKNTFLLTSHQDPDGDSVGSLMGFARLLEQLGKKTILINQGKVPAKYRFLDPDGEIRHALPSGGVDAEVAIIMECPRFERIGFVAEIITPEMTLVNIDHHKDNNQFGQINIVDTTACALGQILCDLFIDCGFEISKEMATALYAAIISDTGCFRFANTDAGCLRTAALLIDKGADPKAIYDKIFLSLSVETLKLLGHILRNMEIFAGGRICVLSLTKADLDQTGALIENSEGLIDYTMMMPAVDIGVMLKEHDSETIRVSLRSQDGIDIGQFAKTRGGGGHVNASGFTIHGRLDNAKESVVAALTEFLNG